MSKKLSFVFTFIVGLFFSITTANALPILHLDTTSINFTDDDLDKVIDYYITNDKESGIATVTVSASDTYLIDKHNSSHKIPVTFSGNNSKVEIDLSIRTTDKSNSYFIESSIINPNHVGEYSGTTTLTLEVSKIINKITLDNDGVKEVIEAEQEKTIDSIPTPTKAGYTFDGWYDDDNMELTSTYKITGDKTFHAVWLEEYSITYNLDGGTNSTSNPTKYNKKSVDTVLAEPSKTGYTFTGWTGGKNLATELSGIWYSGPGDSIEKSDTGYAMAAEVKPNTYYTVSKKNKGNRFVVIASTVPIEEGTKYSRVLTQGNVDLTTYTFKTQTDEKYIFFGYYNNSDSSGTLESASAEIQIEEGRIATSYEKPVTSPTKEITIPTGSEGNRIYNASWTLASYSVYMANMSGATIGSSTMTWYNGSSSSIFDGYYSTNYTMNTATFSLPSVSRSGYSFNGWKTNKTSTTLKNSISITKGSTGLKVYYADWTKLHTITFNPGSGTLSTSDKIKSIPDGDTIGTLPTPSYDGYKFMGWYTASSGGTKISSSTTASANVTYYAHYEKIYTISYTLNGGALSGKKTTYTISDTPLTIGAPTRSGYTFNGWTGSNGTTKQKTVTIAAGTAKNLSYTANWTRNDQIIYNNGNQYTSYTGGWAATASQTNGKATINSGNMYVGFKALGDSSSNVYTKNSIDLKDFKKVCAYFNVTKYDASNGYTDLILNKPYFKRGTQKSATGYRTECYDISSYNTGAIQLLTCDMDVYIYKVWLTNS